MYSRAGTGAINLKLCDSHSNRMHTDSHHTRAQEAELAKQREQLVQQAGQAAELHARLAAVLSQSQASFRLLA